MTRCKFRCDSKTEYLSMSKLLFDYKFMAVTGGSEENKKFWEWTPSGSLNVGTVKDGSFVVGKEYYLDISEAN